MSKPKPAPLDKPPALPKRMTGHRRSSLALFFRGEDPQDSEEVQTNQRLKPKDQVQLTPEELRQRMPPKILYPQNPRAPQNITRFSFKENQFKKEGAVEQTVFHLAIESTLLLKDSPEAAEQEELLRLREEAQERRRELEAVEVSIEDDGATQDEEGRVMRNQFNNVDRATQIKSLPTVEQSCTTLPPPKRLCCGTANYWMIWDAYVKEAESQGRKENDSKLAGRHPLKVPHHDSARNLVNSDKFKWSLKVLERVVSFNAQQEAYRIFQSTEEEPPEAPLTVIPIWEFRFPRAKGKDAMVLRWNPHYHDLLAVGFGNYEYVKQGCGYVCCFSLKNTSHPEYFWKLDSKVCSLDWHPLQPSLLCVGLYDGNVAVLDATSPSKKPWHYSTVKTGKHTDPVWDVCWEVGTATSQLSFFSVSADGRIMRWTLLKSKLESEVVCSDAASARICFNSKSFVLAVAETGGTVKIVKLPQRVAKVPEKPADADKLSMEAWQAERLNTILLEISEEFRTAANPVDRSMRELQKICQGDSNEAPQAQPAEE
ncbi:dynein intermediate chain, putative [Eimeria brunetti]|uniref:Dynein intermediate chain, putative n=1 Tax=Eimeria brunetti TaxID=51314 RepID=U6LHI5_9EIME|nr:dynein intermediate chain, putative [Eimeria brunetti]